MLCSKCHKPILGKAIVENRVPYCRRCWRGEPNIIIEAMNKPAFWVVMIIFFLLFALIAIVAIVVMFGRT